MKFKFEWDAIVVGSVVVNAHDQKLAELEFFRRWRNSDIGWKTDEVNISKVYLNNELIATE